MIKVTGKQLHAAVKMGDLIRIATAIYTDYYIILDYFETRPYDHCCCRFTLYDLQCHEVVKGHGFFSNDDIEILRQESHED